MIDYTIQAFVTKAIKMKMIAAVDEIYTTNQLLDLLSLKEISFYSTIESKKSLLELLDELTEYAINQGVIENERVEKEKLRTRVMDLVTPRPHEIQDTFWEKYKKDPRDATDYFHQLSQQNNYIKTREIAKNIWFTHPTEYGNLEITINLSKPEKDPKEIAKLSQESQKRTYPECALCFENEGYVGHLAHPHRSNHRIVRLDLNGEEWGFQYSPYAYFNEHSIFISREHRAMNVEKKAYENLLSITDFFPHYFVGSNAGLPIVGGSILSHDHYQGGRYPFPMEEASIERSFELKEFADVKCGRVAWPMSVIRLNGSSKSSVSEAADFIRKKWNDYSDESVNIRAFSNKTPHNAITPIARRRGESFELDLVLRNNQTNEEYPDGIFHPHPDVQHIKKENIGLIEVMGLAILPPRLKEEWEQMEIILEGGKGKIDAVHEKWFEDIKRKYAYVKKGEAKRILEKEVGKVFLRVLEDAGVFKRSHEGEEAFNRFIEYANN
ncbi:UDP-glucose--hexose-1-phosphate uridylyltransferase [Lacticigenium naphthae]|uniref:UDP-glucose--hexose-1-phosphate uridylyltransferase n=1 Tax=Lacticigenium naphthae TaxID=515351 RepID=UPI0004132200|nr:UDP-glucose--hexose-1-phosphate uridylyltransferase [Lacticigenium naphthae]